MGRKKITIPFTDEYFNVQDTICDFAVKDYHKWFVIHPLGTEETEEEKAVANYFLTSPNPYLPKELLETFTDSDNMVLANANQWYTKTEWENFTIHKKDITGKLNTKQFAEEYNKFCKNMRAERWCWGDDSKTELYDSVKYDEDIANMNIRMNGGIPYTIPFWVYTSNAFADDDFDFTSLQVFAIAIISFFTQQRVDRGYLEYLGLIEFYTKSTPMEVRLALLDLYRKHIIYPKINDPRVCDRALCTTSWILNVPAIELKLRTVGMTMNGTMTFAKPNVLD